MKADPTHPKGRNCAQEAWRAVLCCLPAVKLFPMCPPPAMATQRSHRVFGRRMQQKTFPNPQGEQETMFAELMYATKDAWAEEGSAGCTFGIGHDTCKRTKATLQKWRMASSCKKNGMERDAHPCMWHRPSKACPLWKSLTHSISR